MMENKSIDWPLYNICLQVLSWLSLPLSSNGSQWQRCRGCQLLDHYFSTVLCWVCLVASWVHICDCYNWMHSCM